jgi:hypothetical protein
MYKGTLTPSFWKCRGVGGESVLGPYVARSRTSGKNIVEALQYSHFWIIPNAIMTQGFSSVSSARAEHAIMQQNQKEENARRSTKETINEGRDSIQHTWTHLVSSTAMVWLWRGEDGFFFHLCLACCVRDYDAPWFCVSPITRRPN